MTVYGRIRRLFGIRRTTSGHFPRKHFSAACTARSTFLVRNRSAPGVFKNTRTFASLKVRNYRLYAIGHAVSSTGTWIQRIAQDWLVLDLTGSSAAVGVTTALQFAPLLLFGLWGGLLADRYPARKLLLLTQSVLGLTALTLAFLALTDLVQEWNIYAIATLLGMVTAVDNPSRQAFVPVLVGHEKVRNAVSLNSATFQCARLVGPAIGGVLVTTIGSGWAFLVNGFSYAAPLTALLLICPEELSNPARAPHGKGLVRASLRHVRESPDLLWTLVLIACISTFGFNFPVWLPAFAQRVFHADAETYALAHILTAVGALAGALVAARRTDSAQRLLYGSALLFGILEGMAALSPHFLVFGGLLVLVGLFGTTATVTASAELQMAAEPSMRGRVMSLYKMVYMGSTPVGALIIGWLTDACGARWSLFTGGMASMAAAAAVGLRLSWLHRRQDLLALLRTFPAFCHRVMAPTAEMATG